MLDTGLSDGGGVYGGSVEVAARSAFVLRSRLAECVMADLHSGFSSCLAAADERAGRVSDDGGHIRRHAVETNNGFC